MCYVDQLFSHNELFVGARCVTEGTLSLSHCHEVLYIRPVRDNEGYLVGIKCENNWDTL